MVKTRFEIVVDLICKYDDVPKRDRDTKLLNILTEQAALQECSEASVFLELFESTARSPYSKAKILKALVRNGFDRQEKIESGCGAFGRRQTRKSRNFGRTYSRQ